MFYIPPKSNDKWENDMTITDFVKNRKLWNPYVMTENVLIRDRDRDGKTGSVSIIS